MARLAFAALIITAALFTVGFLLSKSEPAARDPEDETGIQGSAEVPAAPHVWLILGAVGLIAAVMAKVLWPRRRRSEPTR